MSMNPSSRAPRTAFFLNLALALLVLAAPGAVAEEVTADEETVAAEKTEGTGEPKEAAAAPDQGLFVDGGCAVPAGDLPAEPIPGDPLFRANTCECTSNADCGNVCFDSGTCLNGWCEPNSIYGGCDCREIGGGPGGGGPGACDDCNGGCSITCSTDTDCENNCPFGIGDCNSGKCLCAC